MRARDIMTSAHLWVCSADTSVRQAAQMMAEHNIGSLPVVDSSGHLQGIVTDRDICLRVVAKDRKYETPVQDVMSMPVHTVDMEADLNDIESLMKEYQVRRLPVVDETRKLCGIISIADLAHHCRSIFREHGVAETLDAISSSEAMIETA